MCGNAVMLIKLYYITVVVLVALTTFNQRMPRQPAYIGAQSSLKIIQQTVNNCIFSHKPTKLNQTGQRISRLTSFGSKLAQHANSNTNCQKHISSYSDIHRCTQGSVVCPGPSHSQKTFPIHWTSFQVKVTLRTLQVFRASP